MPIYGSMNKSRNKRLFLLLSAVAVVVGVYFAAYFASVSVHFQPYHKASLEIACPRYRLGPLSEDFASRLFEPARLIDATYLRPARWRDRRL